MLKNMEGNMMPFFSILGFLACFSMALYFLIKKENDQA